MTHDPYPIPVPPLNARHGEEHDFVLSHDGAKVGDTRAFYIFGKDEMRQVIAHCVLVDGAQSYWKVIE